MRTNLLLFATLLMTAGFPVTTVTLAHPAGTVTGEFLPYTALTQINGWAAIKTDEGVLLVWNGRGLHFTLAISGKEIHPPDESEDMFFYVDDKFLQIKVVEIEAFAPGARAKKLDDRAILAAHREWETKYLENLLKTKLAVHTFNVKLSNGTDASIWQFDMPEPKVGDTRIQLYLTTVRKDRVLLLNSVARGAGFDSEAARKFLMDTIATLKLSSTPIDEKKVAEAIRNGAAP